MTDSLLHWLIERDLYTTATRRTYARARGRINRLPSLMSRDEVSSHCSLAWIQAKPNTESFCEEQILGYAVTIGMHAIFAEAANEDTFWRGRDENLETIADIDTLDEQPLPGGPTPIVVALQSGATVKDIRSDLGLDDFRQWCDAVKQESMYYGLEGDTAEKAARTIRGSRGNYRPRTRPSATRKVDKQRSPDAP